jgi:hypothetical protein
MRAKLEIRGLDQARIRRGHAVAGAGQGGETGVGFGLTQMVFDAGANIRLWEAGAGARRLEEWLRRRADGWVT